MYLNKAVVIGNLTRDPELKALPSGSSVASFSIATNHVYKDKEGAKKEETEFHNIVVFGKQAETAAQYLKKGSQALVEGRLQTRSWETDGHKNYRTEIVADRVVFGSKPKVEATDREDERSEPDTNDPTQFPAEGSDIDPDSIPF